MGDCREIQGMGRLCRGEEMTKFWRWCKTRHILDIWSYL